MDASVIVVGDEVLAGHVQDANSHFIATRITLHGHRLRRVAIVGDDPGEIAGELRRSLEGSDLVFVCGGLGPTHDDRTMEGVAAALGRVLAPCAELVEWIEAIVERVGRAGFAGDAWGVEGLRKMALAPEGSEVLRSAAGVGPAVTIEDPHGRVFVLPGPPKELQAVFLECVEPRFLEGTGAVLWREELTHPFPESALAAVMMSLAATHPDCSIGSYPQHDHVLIRIAGPAEAAQAVAAELRAHLEEMQASEDGRRVIEFMRSHRERRARETDR